MEQKIFEMMLKMDEKLNKIDGRLDKMDDRFDKMDDRFDKMDDRFDLMKDEIIKNAKWLHDEVTEIRADIKGTQNIKKLYSEEALKAVEAV